MRRLSATAAIAAFLVLCVSAPAPAQDILNDFRRNGTINPCQYSDGQLRRGLQGLPPDIQQYAPGLADQLAAGREGCGGGGGGGLAAEAGPAAATAGGGGPAGPAGAPQVKVPAPPAPKAKARSRLADIETPTVTGAATSSDTPGWLAPVVAVAALVLLLLGLARFRGWSAERITRPLGAAYSEASGRTADAVAELRESARFGR